MLWEKKGFNFIAKNPLAPSVNHCLTYHSMFEPCCDDRCNELVQRSIVIIIHLSTTTNLIVTMETKPNPLMDGMKHLTNLMLSFASWEETYSMKLQRWSHHFWTFWKHLIPSSQYVGPNVKSLFQILMDCGELCEVWKCNYYRWIWIEGGRSHFDDNSWSIKLFFQIYAILFTHLMFMLTSRR